MTATVLSLIVLGVLWGGVYLLMAEGLNLIYGVMKAVNLAHGEMIVLGGLLSFSLFSYLHLSPPLALPVVAVVLFLIGGAIQAGVLERITGEGEDYEIRTLLATFGLSYVISNVSFLIWGSQFQSIPFLQGFLSLGAFRIPEGLLVCSAVALVLAIGVHLWLTRTITGRTLHATAQSQLGAESCGLNTRRIRILAFALGSAMAGAAGCLAIALIPFQTSSGVALTIQAFTLIALGGLGNYIGAAVAALVLGLSEVLSQYYLGSNAAEAAIYVIFIAVLVFRPQGLFGKATRE